jgi:hypothetical protein
LSDDLAVNRERVLQNATARQRDLAATPAKSATVTSPSLAPFVPNARVFDTVSGQEGTIVPVVTLAGQRTPVIMVRLDSGGLVGRPPDRLIARPTPPIVTP